MPESSARPLRLRQICLVAAELAAPLDDLKAIFGLAECNRDPNVAAYGLENVLLPVGTDFLEIVSPTRPGTAAGRFLERHKGRHGYMIIMDCDDPARRQRHCESIGVRTAHQIRHPGYLGVQLHPGDTGGAMLEFNRTEGGESPLGAYAPAGRNWQGAIRTELTRRLVAAEIQCADPAGFSAHWSRILERPAEAMEGGCRRIGLDAGEIRFVPGDGAQAALTGLVVQVADRDRVIHAARLRGCLDAAGGVDVCGVGVRLIR